ncbi:glycoprotein 3-alpha-L-fucosyltransferase A isoform X2 [Momordica charantia]|uniref:Fucosyltransferase n=1 Tax=Momordica charantia TaxID=3673 RepID=A0A6J1D7W2_MOMCH|nr:glycoprotein 3-alpha-L-fucosyltransferase A isoform X2 [Momordica charantia]
MSIFANQRGSRSWTTGEELPVSNGVPIPPKKKWSNAMPLFIALVVIAEIIFLGRLDVAKNVAMVDSWADLFYRSPPSRALIGGADDFNSRPLDGDRISELGICEEWLEKEDAVTYARDFEKEPILVSGSDEGRKSCAVGCEFETNSSKDPDAAFGLNHQGGMPSIIRSMESSQYYGENNIAQARRSGYSIVMTTSLSSDVPVGYFSWAEYDIMAPVTAKSESALAAAFISNCGARNFRLEALEALEKLNVTIHSYGACHRNRDGSRVDKVKTLKRYKFSLAFENSNEEDYVTEKYFQSLVAGTVPVVVGAPNIQEFAPSPGSVLHIRELSDVESVANSMKYIAANPVAFNNSLRWKYEGPTDSFKALLDMAAVHSSCRLCIHLATGIHEREEEGPAFKKRPCKCTRGSDTVYHLYVRERGRFNLESIFLRSSNLTVEALESAVLSKFSSLKHEPIWKQERPESIRGGDELKLYKIYPVGLTQRQALHTFKFKGDSDLRTHVEDNPCAKFEVIFV